MLFTGKLPAINEDGKAARGVFERIAIVERQVCILADFQRADLVGHPENAGGFERDGDQGALESEALAGGYCGFKQYHAGLGHVGLVAALNGEGHPGGAKFSCRLHAEVLQVAKRTRHRGMQQDGETGGLDFIEHHRSV